MPVTRFNRASLIPEIDAATRDAAEETRANALFLERAQEMAGLCTAAPEPDTLDI